LTSQPSSIIPTSTSGSCDIRIALPRTLAPSLPSSEAPHASPSTATGSASSGFVGANPPLTGLDPPNSNNSDDRSTVDFGEVDDKSLDREATNEDENDSGDLSSDISDHTVGYVTLDPTTISYSTTARYSHTHRPQCQSAQDSVAALLLGEDEAIAVVEEEGVADEVVLLPQNPARDQREKTSWIWANTCIRG
jgi:hypothetical protein